MILGATTTSVTLLVAGVRLVVVPFSAPIACALAIVDKVIQKVFMIKHNKYKKLYEKDLLTLKSFDKLYKKSLQNFRIDESEYESFCNKFSKYVDQTKNECFL